jgi:outer membrane protein OmpA-like peptidoglycan-associated protein
MFNNTFYMNTSRPLSRIFVLLFGCFLWPQITISQKDPTFDPFEGTIYYIPGDYLNDGFGPHLPYLEVIGKVILKSLNIPKTYTHAFRFPGSILDTQFGVIFLSKLHIRESGCYEFSLESDDGSILWISDSLVIDNDKTHKMTIKRDTMMLDTGIFPVRIWYYNAFESQYGLIFNSRAMPELTATQCIPILPVPEKKMIELNTVLFNLNSSAITIPGMAELDKVCEEIIKAEFKKVSVFGYTDDSGTVAYNAELSLQRAQAVLKYIKDRIQMDGIEFEAIGKGIAKDMGEGNESESKQQNRKVEIFIE